MEPTKKSIKKNKKSVRRINILLNDLKEEPSEENVYKIIKTLFNTRHLKLKNDYLDLVCSLFGDKLIELNNIMRPDYESSEQDDEEDGYEICLIKLDDNQKLELFNVANQAAIKYSHCEQTGKWSYKWQELRFLLEQEKQPTLEIINSSSNSLQDEHIPIDMNKTTKEIINDITNIVGYDFLPSGLIRKSYLNSYNKKLKKNKDI
ncbi:MAG: hypothetical protein VZS44_03620 [Bacilli bacterium]|nr:hypothetical protein [Bacilli bacterium]